MANDENKHINNQNNRYNGNQLHDDFIHGHSNEELIPKAHDINDIEQYIHNIPALNDPSNRNTLNNITKPSVNFCKSECNKHHWEHEQLLHADFA